VGARNALPSRSKHLPDDQHNTVKISRQHLRTKIMPVGLTQPQLDVIRGRLELQIAGRNRFLPIGVH